MFLASESLYEQIELFLGAEDEQAEDRKTSKLFLAMARYGTRMCTREIPFGLFATVSVGRIGDETVLRVSDLELARRHTRLDCGVTYEIARILGDEICAGCTALTHVPLIVESTLHFVNGEWRFVEYARRNDAVHLAAAGVKDSPHLRLVVETARGGGATVDALVDKLSAFDSELESAEIVAFLRELLMAGVLHTGLLPPITGVEPLAHLISHLPIIPLRAKGRRELATVWQLLQQAPTFLKDSNVSTYIRLSEALKGLIPRVKKSRLVHVDLYRPAPDLALDRGFVSEVLDAVGFLGRVRPLVQSNENKRLSEFRKKFSARYGRRLVPLLQVLDADSGIGFGPSSFENPLLREIGCSPYIPGPPPQWDADWRALLTRKIADLRGAAEVSLTLSDLEPLLVDSLPGGGNTGVVNIWMLNATDVGRHRARLNYIRWRSAADLFGRFCHGDDGLLDQVRAIASFEQQRARDIVLAEICHSPRTRMGNVISRPLLRGYEIPCGSRSGAPTNRQLSLDQLMLMVDGDEIHLYSVELNAWIRPMLASAHNHSESKLPVYQFLCLLAGQGHSNFGFMWPEPLDALVSLPRVCYGSMVLAPASWKIRDDQRKELVSSDLPQHEAMSRMRRSLGLPDLVNIVVDRGAKTMLCDLSSPMGASLLIHEAKRQRELTIEESLFDERELVAARDGHYLGELLIPFAVDNSLRKQEVVRNERPKPTARSTKINGCERDRHHTWIYQRLFTGRGYADEVIMCHIWPLVEDLAARRIIDRWHFVRYEDPDSHIRLRVRVRGKDNACNARERLCQAAAGSLDEGKVWRASLDTYDPEVERYGGQLGILHCEQIFTADSTCVVRILERLGEVDDRGHLRWRVALSGLDSLLRDFDFSLNERHQITIDQSSMLKRHMGLGQALDMGAVSRKYRSERAELLALVSGCGARVSGIGPCLAELEKRSHEIDASVSELKEAARTDRLAGPLAGIATSVAHMFLNRLLLDDGVIQEFLLYEFLRRLYASQQYAPSTRCLG
jgi:thiopeptide-type bacteriocin biosynthesis protein